MAKVPEMITGPRQPRSTRKESMVASTDAPVPMRPKQDGTHYVSAYRNYRIQLTSPSDQLDASGRIIRGKNLVAQFREWQYINNSPDLEVRAQIDMYMQSNPRFGLALDFWTAEEQERLAQEKRLTDARRTLRSLPKETVLEFLAELEGAPADHEMPTPPETKQ